MLKIHTVQIKRLLLCLLITSISTSTYAQQIDSTANLNQLGLQELSDEELDNITGGNPLIPVAVLMAEQAGLSTGTYILKQIINEQPITPRGLAESAALGAVGGTVNAIAKVSQVAIAAAPAITKTITKSIEYITKIASGAAGSQVDKQPTPPTHK